MTQVQQLQAELEAKTRLKNQLLAERDAAQLAINGLNTRIYSLTAEAQGLSSQITSLLQQERRDREERERREAEQLKAAAEAAALAAKAAQWAAEHGGRAMPTGHLQTCKSILSEQIYDPECTRCGRIKVVVLLQRKTVANGSSPEEEKIAAVKAAKIRDEWSLKRGEIFDKLYYVPPPPPPPPPDFEPVQPERHGSRVSTNASGRKRRKRDDILE